MGKSCWILAAVLVQNHGDFIAKPGCRTIWECDHMRSCSNTRNLSFMSFDTSSRKVILNHVVYIYAHGNKSNYWPNCPTKVFRVPTEWNCSCKKVMDQWWMGCLSSRGKKNRGFWPCFGLIPTLKHHPQTPGPLGPPGSIFARPTLQTATGPAVVATAGESLGGTQARSPGTMWALMWSSWRVNHKGCCGCCLDGFLFQVLVPTSQFGWISWGSTISSFPSDVDVKLMSI